MQRLDRAKFEQRFVAAEVFTQAATAEVKAIMPLAGLLICLALKVGQPKEALNLTL